MDRKQRHDLKRRAERPWRGWYSTKRWRKKRAEQLAREPLCRMCKAMEKVTAATVADHVVPHKGDADLFWTGELQSTCETHHNATKAAEERSGLVVGNGLDGKPLDQRHPWARSG